VAEEISDDGGIGSRVIDEVRKAVFRADSRTKEVRIKIKCNNKRINKRRK